MAKGTEVDALADDLSAAIDELAPGESSDLLASAHAAAIYRAGFRAGRDAAAAAIHALRNSDYTRGNDPAWNALDAAYDDVRALEPKGETP